jgi:hypothetical protein
MLPLNLVYGNGSRRYVAQPLFRLLLGSAAVRPTLESILPYLHRGLFKASPEEGRRRGSAVPAEAELADAETKEDGNEEPNVELHDREHEEIVRPIREHEQSRADAFCAEAEVAVARGRRGTGDPKRFEKS